MNRLRNTAIWFFFAAVFTLFWVPALTIERQRFFEILDAVICAAAFALALSTIKSVWRTIRMPIRDVRVEQVYVVGLFLISVAASLTFGGLWAWRSLGKSDAIADSEFIAFTRWLFAVGQIMTLLINLGEDGRLTMNSYARTAALITSAVAVAALLAWLSA